MDNNFELDSIDSSHLDVLREIGNIGAGNAMTALAQMLQRKVDMKVPKADLFEFRDLGEVRHPGKYDVSVRKRVFQTFDRSDARGLWKFGSRCR